MREESLALCTTSRGKAQRWLYELGYALGEEAVKDARAQLK